MITQYRYTILVTLTVVFAAMVVYISGSAVAQVETANQHIEQLRISVLTK